MGDATEINRAGIWAWGIAHRQQDVGLGCRIAQRQVVLGHANLKPPMMLMNRIRMPAIASPRTNLEHRPWNRGTRLLRPLPCGDSLASLSSIRPALRSASMAIFAQAWRPGEAGTDFWRSAPEPLVTTKLITTRITKHDQTDGKVAPIRKCPNDSITPAAPFRWAFHQHHRVEATFSDRRNRVVNLEPRKSRKVQRAQRRVYDHHHHHQGGGNVEGEEQVQHKAGSSSTIREPARTPPPAGPAWPGCS